ncbi:DUF2776 family protein [Streptomyces violaceoruber]|uniref:DUF2776 family protein n=1 Tax=Streptomyces violaceoruber group TaxID=2867121 RepID=UPI001B36A1EB|nr:DUF2776 family protein [Streptomyces sp. RK76]
MCWSIHSRVLLPALVWRRTAPLANRAPLIPVGTALFCRFLAALLVETADSAVVVAARVPIGLGALCFSLFSLVSVLESGIGDGADGEGEPEGSGTAADL